MKQNIEKNVLVKHISWKKTKSTLFTVSLNYSHFFYNLYIRVKGLEKTRPKSLLTIIIVY